MKHFVALCLIAAFAPGDRGAHAGGSVRAPGYPPVVLSAGSVSPDSGNTGAYFTYQLHYSNSSNLPPDHVWVGIWWGSRGTRYWYELSPRDPSATGYLNGVWYGFAISGLDTSAHFFRFVVEAQGALTCWPEPGGTYYAGPTVSGTSVRLGSAMATLSSGVQPSILVAADKTQVSSGGYVTFTVTVAAPSGQSATARGVFVAYTPDAMFDPVDGTSPALIKNTATCTWSRGSATTPVVKVRVLGASAALYPAGQVFIADCGDLAAGETVVCTFRCRAK